MGATNSLAGLNPTMIAQETAKTLLPMLQGLKYFTLDLSNDVREKGEAVVTRVVTALSDADTSSGYDAVVQNTTTTAITVTLNRERGAGVEYTAAEMAKASVNLQQMVYEPMANAAAKGIYDYVFSLIVNASFSQKVTIAAASFDSDGLVSVRTVLNKAYAPKNRAFFGNSDVFDSLMRDASFKAAYASGSTQTIRDGEIGRGMGFDLIETPYLPNNSENLIGFGSSPQAIAFAARRLPTPEAALNANGYFENLTIADVPFTFVAWYDIAAKKYKMALDCLYGASKGVPGNLCRVVSA